MKEKKSNKIPTPLSPEKPRKRKIRREPFSLKELFQREKEFFLLLFTGILLRFLDLGRQGLWIDEICCWNDATGHLQRIMRTMHKVVFLLERVSMNLGGHNEFFLRLPSAFGGLLAIILIYPLGKLLFNRRAALFTMILLVFSPISIYYSQDANYYSLMMALTIVSLYFLFLFMKSYNPLWLAPYGIFSYLNYHVHPANILLTACQLIPLVLFLIFDAGMRERYHKVFNHITRNKFAFAGAAGILVILLAFIGLRFFRFIYRLSISSYGEALSENLEFSPRFFLKLTMDYGIAFQQYKPHVFALTILVLLFFFFGLFHAVKKQRFFALYVFLTWTLPFAAIYIKRIGHFYHCRYTAFIVPGFLILVAFGVERFAAYLKEKKGLSRFANPAVFSVFVLFFAGIAPNLFRYYTGHKQDWKGAATFLKKNLAEGEKVVSHLHANDDALRFYYDYLNLNAKPIVKLSGEFPGSSYTSLYRLKKMCLLEPAVYFATSYTRYEDPLLVNWVEKYFDVAFHRPSLHPEEFNREGKEVILYRFSHSGNYIFPPHSYQFQPETPMPLEQGFHRKFLFGADGEYRFEFDSEIPAQEEAFSLQVEKEGGAPILTDFSLLPESKGKTFVASLSLEEGVCRISLLPREKPNLDIRLAALRIIPEYHGLYHREAEDTDLYHPTPYKRVESHDGARCFVLERNNYLYYDPVPFPHDGRYGFTLRALQDQPGPVIIEVSLNWKPLGLVIFDKADNSWGDAFFPFEAPQGEHIITLQFLAPPEEISKRISGTLPSDRFLRTEAHLDYFQIKTLEPDEPFPDMRLDFSKSIPPPSPLLERSFENPLAPGTLANAWQIQPLMPYQFVLDEENPRNPSSLQIPLSPDSKGLNLISPLVPVAPGSILYFSAWLKVDQLDNHSANMRVAYADENKEMLNVDIVNADGITGSTDWTRQVYLRPVPEGAHYASIVFWVYQNSSRRARHEGYFKVNAFQFENPFLP